jgi:arylsulfatase A-like enzyme
MLVSRRYFFFGSLALPALPALAAKKEAAQRPGILLLLADQMPSFMLGAYGNKQVHTPNLDRLAQTGIRFSNHFACAPAPDAGRATLLTGRTPMQLGPSGVASANEITLDKLLSANGYTTQETAKSADAVAFLDRQSAGKPFYLQVNFRGVRPPYDPAKKYLDRYAAESFDGYEPEHPAPNAAAGKEYLSSIIPNVRKAAASVTAMDDEIGLILNRVRERQLLGSTLIIFTSSCGAFLGRRGLWDSSDATNPPNMFDDAVSTPIFYSWLGHVPALAARPELISAYDFIPTMCDMLSLPVPQRNLCGRSYAPLATGKPLPNKKDPWRLILCASHGNTDMGREERFKLILRDNAAGPNELYDLSADPKETIDRFPDEHYLTVHQELANAISSWKLKYSGDVPPAAAAPGHAKPAKSKSTAAKPPKAGK